MSATPRIDPTTAPTSVATETWPVGDDELPFAEEVEVATDEEAVATVDPEATARSDGCQLIWIMGAETMRAEMVVVMVVRFECVEVVAVNVSGYVPMPSISVPSATYELKLQRAVVILVSEKTFVHVWAGKSPVTALWHAKPL